MNVRAMSLPLDVKLMNGVASTVFAGVALALLAAGALWLARAPVFAIQNVQLEGEVSRNSMNTIRANAAPQLAGNFFSLNLRQAQQAFEGVPWVSRAVVRRVWPNRLLVRLEEHRPAALWLGHVDSDSDSDSGADSDDRLVNSFGEVFQANVGDVEDDGLPRLAGPEGSAAAMLVMLQRLAPAFQRLGLGIDKLHLSGRGSWRVHFDKGAVVELGRGSEDDVAARAERFARTVSQMTSRFNKPIEYADLRHADGYALRLRGVTTTVPTLPATGTPP